MSRTKAEQAGRGGERRERGEDKKEKKSLGKYPAAHSI